MKQTIKAIMDNITNELVITSVGTISREVFAYRDRPQNLYLMGAMGCTLGVGIGLALNTKKQVMVIAGDGDMLMSLGTLVLLRSLQLSNLKLFILDNNSYEATGRQATCSRNVNFTAICPCGVYPVTPALPKAPRITLTPKEIQERFYNAVNSL